MRLIPNSVKQCQASSRPRFPVRRLLGVVCHDSNSPTDNREIFRAADRPNVPCGVKATKPCRSACDCGELGNSRRKSGFLQREGRTRGNVSDGDSPELERAAACICVTMRSWKRSIRPGSRAIQQSALGLAEHLDDSPDRGRSSGGRLSRETARGRSLPSVEQAIAANEVKVEAWAQKLFLHRRDPPPGGAFETRCFPLFWAARSLGPPGLSPHG